MKFSTLDDGLKPVVFYRTKDGYKITYNGYWVEMTKEDIANYTGEITDRLGGILGLLQIALIEKYKEAE